MNRNPLPPHPALPLLLLLLVGSGCAHRVTIQSDPAGARVSYRDEPMGVAPVTLRTTWLPFKKMPVTVEVAGYRATTINLQKDVGPFRLLGELLRPWKWDRWWGGEVRARHELMLTREHGKAGTWTEEDAKR